MQISQNNRIYCDITEAMEFVERCIKKGIIPFLVGPPGISKTANSFKIAEKYNLKPIPIILSQRDPVDLLGNPIVVNGRSDYAPPIWMPLENDPLPTEIRTKIVDGVEVKYTHKFDGWLILFDELPNAVPAMQKASYSILQERMCGGHKLHANVAMMATGNGTGDRAYVQKLSTAMQSRLCTIEVISFLDGWLIHAEDRDFDFRLRSFVSFIGTANDFNPDHKDNTFMCERTLEKVALLLEDMPTVERKFKPVIAGCMGIGKAEQFITFCEIYKDLPTFESIINSPDTAIVPADKATAWALTGSLSKQITLKNIDKIMIYILKMDSEFQIITLRGAMKKEPKLIDTPSVMRWSMKHAERLVRAA